MAPGRSRSVVIELGIQHGFLSLFLPPCCVVRLFVAWTDSIVDGGAPPANKRNMATRGSPNKLPSNFFQPKNKNQNKKQGFDRFWYHLNSGHYVYTTLDNRLEFLYRRKQMEKKMNNKKNGKRIKSKTKINLETSSIFFFWGGGGLAVGSFSFVSTPSTPTRDYLMILRMRFCQWEESFVSFFF